jgi:hypothetical protein
MCVRARPVPHPGHPDLRRACATAGKAAVEFGLDEWDHVDAVDALEALAVKEPRCVDVRPLYIDATHHDAR